MATETIVFYPSGGVGHLTPTVELAKLFILHNFKATIVLIDSPSPSSTITSVTSAITSSNPSISFHRLPPPSPSSSPPPSTTHPLVNSFHLRRLSNPLLLSYLTHLSQSTRISAIVLDFFCTAALDVAAQLRIPSYFFFASNASNLSASLRLPSFLPTLPSPLKDLGDTPLHFPGLPPIPASHISVHYQDPNGPTYHHFVSMFEDMAKADGIIVNTFEALERRAVEALAQGPFPKTYCIGPLLSPPADEGKNQRHACLTWLDGQPKGSVVFLCFGSMGNFPEAQLKEIAVGLERSGQRFLWVARNPKGEDPEKPVEAFLPEGFVERTERRGLVVKSWAPQTAVLSHEAVGGFVTHCGWNSALEGVTFGVAMIAWPLYAEQWLNKVILVEEARLAVGMEGYDMEMVKGEEVEKKVRWLMETEEGNELKARAAADKEAAIAARKEGGSSDLAWKELVRAIKKD